MLIFGKDHFHYVLHNEVRMAKKESTIIMSCSVVCCVYNYYVYLLICL